MLAAQAGVDWWARGTAFGGFAVAAGALALSVRATWKARHRVEVILDKNRVINVAERHEREILTIIVRNFGRAVSLESIGLIADPEVPEMGLYLTSLGDLVTNPTMSRLMADGESQVWRFDLTVTGQSIPTAAHLRAVANLATGVVKSSRVLVALGSRPTGLQAPATPTP